jgi:hypothetical protein
MLVNLLQCWRQQGIPGPEGPDLSPKPQHSLLLSRRTRHILHWEDAGDRHKHLLISGAVRVASAAR